MNIYQLKNSGCEQQISITDYGIYQMVLDLYMSGKHIKIQKVLNSGSINFKYKSYHSIVLTVCGDANGNFIIIETGFADRNSDASIFRASTKKYFYMLYS